MWLYLLLLSLPSPSKAVSSSQETATIERVASSKYWKRLLHFHGGKSDVVGDSFFFSPRGKKDPRAELIATLEAFEKGTLAGRDPKKLQPAPCAFPERFRFLKEAFELKSPELPCPLFEEFMAKFRPVGATLVFSAAYPYNPGSMFGHTFLRINSNQRSADGKFRKQIDLLDHGLSYAAAVPEDENSAAFVWNGLTGGYAGHFTVLPYYMKVNEYNNSESRDLWEYELDLDAEQTRRLLAHTWELEMNATFDYYFFTANCSYQLLSLLEVARADWDLSEGWLHVIPSETVKAVAKVPGAVRSVHFRPSLYKKALARNRNLSTIERQSYEGLIRGETDGVKSLPAYGAAISHFYYRKQKASGHLKPEEQKIFEKILIARSKIPEGDPEEPEIPGTSRPDLGHYTNRVATSGGAWREGTDSFRYFQELHFRPAYHDLLNNDLGFTPFSEIDLFGLKLRYIPKSGLLFLEEVQIASIVSLSPWTSMEKPLSWKFQAGYYGLKDEGCYPCHAGRFEGGAGLSTELLPGTLFFALGKLKAETGGGIPGDFRFRQGLETGLLWSPFSAWKWELAGEVYTDFFRSVDEKTKAQLRARTSFAFGPSWELRASYLHFLPEKNIALRHQETQLDIGYYF